MIGNGLANIDRGGADPRHFELVFDGLVNELVKAFELDQWSFVFRVDEK